jgi:hypothetical protein
MKLSQKTEWLLVGVLIVYIAFLQPLPVLQDMMATSIGKAAALAGVVYVWKYVSAIVALLLAVAVMRCMSMGRVWEMFSGAETSCVCEQPETFMWDPTTKKCMDKDGKEGPVKSCVCASGYAWDGGEKGTKQCIPVSGTQPPVPAPDSNPVAEQVASMEAAVRNAAPAEAGTPTTGSTPPITTPGAAAEMAAGVVSVPMTPGGVQPGATTTASTPATL